MRFLVVVATLLWAACAWAEESRLEQQFARVSPAVGALYAQTASGNLEFLCTITVVASEGNRSELVTANHCVRKDVAYVVTLDGRLFHSARVWKVPGDAIDPQKFRRQYGQPEADIAVFVVPAKLDVTPVAIGDDSGLPRGRAILTVGYPLGVTKIGYTGFIAGRYERPGADMDGYLILQMFASPGSSGSAVIEEATGKIVGVLVSGRQAFGTPVIFGVPISYLRYLREVPRPGESP